MRPRAAKADAGASDAAGRTPTANDASAVAGAAARRGTRRAAAAASGPQASAGAGPGSARPSPDGAEAAQVGVAAWRTCTMLRAHTTHTQLSHGVLPRACAAPLATSRRT
jgi:hypothetical protein